MYYKHFMRIYVSRAINPFRLPTPTYYVITVRTVNSPLQSYVLRITQELVCVCVNGKERALLISFLPL